MRRFVRDNVTTIEWTIGIVVVMLPSLAWVSQQTTGSGITLYDIFPPLGLVAFGLMWTHFVMGALRRYAGVVNVDFVENEMVELDVVQIGLD